MKIITRGLNLERKWRAMHAILLTVNCSFSYRVSIKRCLKSIDRTKLAYLKQKEEEGGLVYRGQV